MIYNFIKFVKYIIKFMVRDQSCPKNKVQRIYWPKYNSTLRTKLFQFCGFQLTMYLVSFSVFMKGQIAISLGKNRNCLMLFLIYQLFRLSIPYFCWSLISKKPSNLNIFVFRNLCLNFISRYLLQLVTNLIVKFNFEFVAPIVFFLLLRA